MSDRGRSNGLRLPAIDPVPSGVARPFWSVMMPTYNCLDHFEHALRSVLEQDPGADQMHIAVIDDCSTNGRSEEVVKRMAPMRVEFYRQPKNVGLALNWNTCVRRSRGLWVHLLHQDDLVLPGYYKTMERSIREQPEIGAAFCRYAYIDNAGQRTSASEPERETAGILEGWLEAIAVGQRIECPAIVVRRATYEQLGGFTPELYFALDWEMWVRIAAHYPVWYEPDILACYRRHDANETTRLDRVGADLPDVLAALRRISRHVPPDRRRELHGEAVQQLRWRWFREAGRLMEAGRCVPAIAHVWHAYQNENLAARSKAMFAHSKWAIKVILRSLVPVRRSDYAARASRARPMPRAIRRIVQTRPVYSRIADGNNPMEGHDRGATGSRSQRCLQRRSFRRTVKNELGTHIMKVGIYEPAWGELICGAHMYVAKMGDTLTTRGHDVTVVFHRERIPRATLAEAYGLDFSRIHFRDVAADELNTRERPGPLARFFARSPDRKDLSQPYDLFIYSTSGEVPPISHAARGILVVYFPCVSYEEYHGYMTEAWRCQPAPVRAYADIITRGSGTGFLPVIIL